MNDLSIQLNEYRLTTAENLYYIPDHPGIAQSFVWQLKDRAPRYPKLHEFLEYGQAYIDATIHSVAVVSREEN